MSNDLTCKDLVCTGKTKKPVGRPKQQLKKERTLQIRLEREQFAKIAALARLTDPPVKVATLAREMLLSSLDVCLEQGVLFDIDAMGGKTSDD